MSQLLLMGSDSARLLTKRLRWVHWAASSGATIPPGDTHRAQNVPKERIAIEYSSTEELAAKAKRALSAVDSDREDLWKLLMSQGIHRGRGIPGRTAFLFPGEGSQYVNMLRQLGTEEGVVRDTFAEADRFAERHLGAPLTALVWADPESPEQVQRAQELLTETAIVQCAAVTVDVALTRLLQSEGILPDLLMGHSLGEYAALVVAGSLSLTEALRVVLQVSMAPLEKAGRMAVAFAGADEVQPILQGVDGFVALANVNSPRQVVYGGESTAVDEAVDVLEAQGIKSFALPVTKAFHTALVAPIAGAVRRALEQTGLGAPRLPIVRNVDGQFHPWGDGSAPDSIPELLARQVCSPVRFTAGLETLYAAGARVFVEVGPKKALSGFVEDTLSHRRDVVALYTNHPKQGGRVSFNRALGALYAAGVRQQHSGTEQSRESWPHLLAVGE